MEDDSLVLSNLKIRPPSNDLMVRNDDRTLGNFSLESSDDEACQINQVREEERVNEAKKGEEDWRALYTNRLVNLVKEIPDSRTRLKFMELMRK